MYIVKSIMLAIAALLLGGCCAVPGPPMGGFAAYGHKGPYGDSYGVAIGGYRAPSPGYRQLPPRYAPRAHQRHNGYMPPPPPRSRQQEPRHRYGYAPPQPRHRPQPPRYRPQPPRHRYQPELYHRAPIFIGHDRSPPRYRDRPRQRHDRDRPRPPRRRGG